jgi:hypothetical protein
VNTIKSSIKTKMKGKYHQANAMPYGISRSSKLRLRLRCELRYYGKMRANAAAIAIEML